MIKLPTIGLVSAQVHEVWIKSKKAHGGSSRISEDDEELMAP
jgi:hypothetical protein